MDGQFYDYATDSINNSPYHPDYGFIDKFRLNCVELASMVGVRAAAEAAEVSKASIYRWRKDYDDRA